MDIKNSFSLEGPRPKSVNKSDFNSVRKLYQRILYLERLEEITKTKEAGKKAFTISLEKRLSGISRGKIARLFFGKFEEYDPLREFVTIISRGKRNGKYDYDVTLGENYGPLVQNGLIPYCNLDVESIEEGLNPDQLRTLNEIRDGKIRKRFPVRIDGDDDDVIEPSEREIEAVETRFRRGK